MFAQSFFQAQIKKITKLRVTGLGWETTGEATDGFFSQRASNAENVSIWWRHHAMPIIIYQLRMIFSGIFESATHRPATKFGVFIFLFNEFNKTLSWGIFQGIHRDDLHRFLKYFDTGPIIFRSDHDDVIKWKHFPRYWPFVRGIHRSPVNSPHKGQWRLALMFSMICGWINDWVNNREAGDLRRHPVHYDVAVMTSR